MTSRKIIFVSLADNQARFFYELGKRLEAFGASISHICFHEGSHKWITSCGGVSYNPYRRLHNRSGHFSFNEFNIDNVAFLLGHEKSAYETRNTAAIIKKFEHNLLAMESIIGEISTGEPVILIQELGGFTSVLSAYFAARKLGHDAYFIEPSFFKGHVFMTLNTLEAPVILFKRDVISSVYINDYIRRILSSQSIVIPIKDRPHYRRAINKLSDVYNMRRLFEKLYGKYILKEKEEFQYIFGHISRHLRMQLASFLLSRAYKEIPNDPFIYYPFHVPSDVALTIRSPEYLDQYSTIDYLCRIAPLGFKVAIKEHPALIGAVSAYRIFDLMKKHDNLVMLSPDINNHIILKKSSAVVTVNSKAGAEALLHKKLVFVLGDAFYGSADLVAKIFKLSELRSRLPFYLSQPFSILDDDVKKYFQCVYESSYPGELYDLSDKNIEVFASSIVQRTKITKN